MIPVLLIALLAWILGLFLPWWSLAIPCFVLGAWLGKSGGRSFLYGFTGIALLWLLQSLFIHVGNDGILTARIAELFSIPDPILVILITALIGGIAGGLSTLTGFFFSKTLLQKQAVG